MFEIEIGVLVSQRPDRRIPYKSILVSDVSWERGRNAERARVNWMFTVDRVRSKLRRADPVPADQSTRAAP